MTQLFENATQALVFAYAYQSQQYPESQMSKMMKRRNAPSGKGLVSTDGAGQVGMIKARIERLSREHQACIVARYSLRFESCPCCGGKEKMLDEYVLALSVLRDWLLTQITGVSTYQSRQLIVRAFYEKDLKFGREVDKIGWVRRTATDHKARVWPALKLLDATAQGEIMTILQDMCCDE